MPVQVLAALCPVPLPAIDPGKAGKDGPSVWASATHLGNQMEPLAWPRIGHCGNLENKPVDGIFQSLFQINKWINLFFKFLFFYLEASASHIPQVNMGKWSRGRGYDTSAGWLDLPKTETQRPGLRWTTLLLTNPKLDLIRQQVALLPLQLHLPQPALYSVPKET